MYLNKKMVQTYVLRKSSRASKKFMITTPEEKKIHFGAKNYEDYTIHKNGARKHNYINRHSVNEDWSKKSNDFLEKLYYNPSFGYKSASKSVSYTHLTLPTKA